MEEEELTRAAEASQRASAERLQQEEQRRSAAHEARKSNVPPEPAADAADKVDLQIRCPDGKRVRRRFLSGHRLGQAGRERLSSILEVYDYLHVEGILGDAAEELIRRRDSTIQTGVPASEHDAAEGVQGAASMTRVRDLKCLRCHEVCQERLEINRWQSSKIV